MDTNQKQLSTSRSLQPAKIGYHSFGLNEYLSNHKHANKIKSKIRLMRDVSSLKLYFVTSTGIETWKKLAIMLGKLRYCREVDIKFSKPKGNWKFFKLLTNHIFKSNKIGCSLKLQLSGLEKFSTKDTILTKSKTLQTLQINSVRFKDDDQKYLNSFRIQTPNIRQLSLKFIDLIDPERSLSVNNLRHLQTLDLNLGRNFDEELIGDELPCYPLLKFKSLNQLKQLSITISGFQGKNLDNLQEMLQDLSQNVQSLKILNLNLFEGCFENRLSIDLPHFEQIESISIRTGTLLSDDEASFPMVAPNITFKSILKNLKSLNVSLLNCNEVVDEYIEQFFVNLNYYTPNLEELYCDLSSPLAQNPQIQVDELLKLRSFKLIFGSNIEDSMIYCLNLKSVNLGFSQNNAQLETLDITIQGSPYFNDTSLNQLVNDISNPELKSMKNLVLAISGCENLKSPDLYFEGLKQAKLYFGCIWDDQMCECTKLQNPQIRLNHCIFLEKLELVIIGSDFLNDKFIENFTKSSLQGLPCLSTLDLYLLNCPKLQKSKLNFCESLPQLKDLTVIFGTCFENSIAQCPNLAETQFNFHQDINLTKLEISLSGCLKITDDSVKKMCTQINSIKTLQFLFFNFTECHSLINPEIILDNLPALLSFSIAFGVQKEGFSPRKIFNACSKLENPLIRLGRSNNLEHMKIMLAGCKMLDFKCLIWLSKGLSDDFDDLRSFYLNCLLCENLHLFDFLIEKFKQSAPNVQVIY